MMVDKGVAITLLTKKWADAYCLALKEKVAEYILVTKGTSVKKVGMTFLLATMLELHVSNIAI